MKTLIKNAFVVSVDPEVGDIPNCDILIEDSQIKAIRPGIEVEGTEVIDAAGCIAMPGFVDTHRHLWEGGMRSVTADWSILDFSGNIRLFAAKFFDPQDMYSTSLHGSLEALNAGITTVAEYCHNVRSEDHGRENLRGVEEAGIRCVWAYGFTPLAKDAKGFSTLEDRFKCFDTLVRDKFSSRDQLLTIGIAPEEPFIWGEDWSGPRRQFDAARDVGARIFLHANSRKNPDGSMMREVAKLKKLGVLGSDLVLVHMGDTDEDEWQMLGNVGGHVSFTPETEYQMGLGWPTNAEPKCAGVNITIGSDITANNSADLFFPLRLFLQVERARMIQRMDKVFFSRTPFECREALEWGTIGGARALGLDATIGSLTVGKDADIVLLRADGVTLAGWDRSNPAATIIQQAGVGDVETVLVAGKVMKKNGRLVADTKRPCALVQETSERIHDRARAEGGFGAPESVMFERTGYTPATKSEYRRFREEGAAAT